MNLIRGVFVALVVFGSVLPYFAAHWLVRHDAVYYRLMNAGWFGRFITDSAEMMNFLSPIPFAVFGLVVGVTLVSTMRCFCAPTTSES